MSETNETAPAFKDGDVVRLKSGGLLMTVTDIMTTGEVRTHWIDGQGHLQGAYLPAHCFEHVDPSRVFLGVRMTEHGDEPVYGTPAEAAVGRAAFVTREAAERARRLQSALNGPTNPNWRA